MLNRKTLEMEIAPSELIKHWGANRHMLNYEALEEVKVPHPSKLYLAEVGLPHEWLEFKFDFQPAKFLTLAELVEETQQVNPLQMQTLHPLNLTQYRYLGNDEVETISVEEITGIIVLVDIIGHPATNGFDNPYIEKGFVNSSIQLFGQFLYLYELAVKQLDAGELTARELHLLNKRFRQMDPFAMEDIDMGIWPTVLEELLLFNFDENEWKELE